MDWLSGLLTSHSALQTVVVLSLICSVGLALGKIRIGGVSLGVAFVFFIGILAGNIGLSVDAQMLDYAETFGLVVFVYMLGLHVGPNFFSSLRHEGMELNLWSFGVIALGTVMAVVLSMTTSVSLPDMVGVLCGATTNTPALGAAQQALSHLGMPSGSAALATAVTYPLGVLGVILAMMLIRKLFVKPEDLELRTEGAENQTYVGQFVVVNPALADKTVAEISQMSHLKFIISRIWRGQQVLVPQADTLLQLYDNVLVVTNKDDIGAMEILFGEKTETDWNGEKIDWNHIDSKVESRTLVLSRKVLNGKRLGHLQLRQKSRYRSTAEVGKRTALLVGCGDIYIMTESAVVITAYRHSFGRRKQRQCHLCTRDTLIASPWLIVVGNKGGNTRFPVGGYRTDGSQLACNSHGRVGKLMQYRRIRAAEHQFDGIRHEHEVVGLEDKISIRVLGREITLQVIDVTVECTGRRKIDNKFAIGQGWQGNRAYKVVTSGRTAKGSGDMSHIGHVQQLTTDAVEVGLHACTIVTLG